WTAPYGRNLPASILACRSRLVCSSYSIHLEKYGSCFLVSRCICPSSEARRARRPSSGVNLGQGRTSIFANSNQYFLHISFFHGHSDLLSVNLAHLCVESFIDPV